MSRPKLIPIAFRPEKTIRAEEQGEGGTIILACRLPPDLVGAAHGYITFYIGKAKKQYAWPSEDNPNIAVKTNEIRITLWPELTRSRFLRVQVKGFKPDGTSPESPLSELLRFAPGSGGYVEAPKDIMAELIEKSHTHPNKEALDRITESPEGLPLWDGEAWPGGEAITYERALEILNLTKEND